MTTDEDDARATMEDFCLRTAEQVIRSMRELGMLKARVEWADGPPGLEVVPVSLLPPLDLAKLERENEKP